MPVRVSNGDAGKRHDTVLPSFAERGDVIQPGKVLMVLLLTRTDVEPGLGGD
ncbi:hypothetical protein [Massilia eurypsychrophila]|uniref:hypothetical protein n=1 Tax=Massilia eurypsychrophila TaxID=1485217 RepID=UPI0015D49020|nr:hypothetical protein [Massilia eurypsychrophila]